MSSIVGGLIALALGILTLLIWQWRVLELIQGLIPLVLTIGGVVAIVAGMGFYKEEEAQTVKKSRSKDKD